LVTLWVKIWVVSLSKRDIFYAKPSFAYFSRSLVCFFWKDKSLLKPKIRNTKSILLFVFFFLHSKTVLRRDYLCIFIGFCMRSFYCIILCVGFWKNTCVPYILSKTNAYKRKDNNSFFFEVFQKSMHRKVHYKRPFSFVFT
jgi:hypothetical protein